MSIGPPSGDLGPRSRYYSRSRLGLSEVWQQRRGRGSGIVQSHWRTVCLAVSLTATSTLVGCSVAAESSPPTATVTVTQDATAAPQGTASAKPAALPPLPRVKDNVWTPDYVMLRKVRVRTDGSAVLTYDRLQPVPLSSGGACTVARYTEPDGMYCLRNESTKERTVGALSSADVLIGGRGVTWDALQEAVVTAVEPDPSSPYTELVYNSKGLATRIAVHPVDSTDAEVPDDVLDALADDPVPEGTEEPPTTAQDQVSVPRFIGLGNKTANSLAMSAGVYLVPSYTNTDPSLRAQALNLCLVVGQSPGAGSVLPRRGTVRVLLDCPLTGYDAPAPPQPWSG